MDKNNIIVAVVAAAIAIAVVWYMNYGHGQPKTLMEETTGQSEVNNVLNNSDATSGQDNATINGTASQSAGNVGSGTAPDGGQIRERDGQIMNATIKTSLGDIKVELFGDKTPITAGNFAKLAEAGFYNGVKFHRVIKGFMIQTGDPLTKDDSMQARWGTGGPGYQFADEPFTGQYTRGTLAMANSGSNTNGSQFFIMHQDYQLPADYVIFGKVTSGIEVVDKIAELPTGSNDCPLTPPVIESVSIVK